MAGYSPNEFNRKLREAHHHAEQQFKRQVDAVNRANKKAVDDYNRKATVHNRKVVTDYDSRVTEHNRRADAHNKKVIADLNRVVEAGVAPSASGLVARCPR